MSGGNIIRADFLTSPQKRLPLYITVACNAGIRRPPAQIFRGKIIHDVRFKLPLKIHHIVRDPETLRHPARIIDRAQATASSVFLLLKRILALPYLHRDPNHFISLFFQQICRNRGIHAARHTYYHLFSSHILRQSPYNNTVFPIEQKRTSRKNLGDALIITYLSSHVLFILASLSVQSPT